MERLKSWISDHFNLLLLIVFFMVLVMNFLSVPTSDDLAYAGSTSIFEIIHNEYLQYMTWTGRSVAHIIARSFLAMPKTIFNICNSLCFVYLTWLMYIHSKGDTKKDQPILYAILVLLVFLFVPLFGQTVLWETGSCNYLWTTTIILQFLWLYRSREAHGTGFAIAMFLFGIVAGWTNENTGGALILFALLDLIYEWRKGNVPKRWRISAIVGACIGFVMMVKAPGNAIRSAEFVSYNGKAYDLIHDITNTLTILNDPGSLYLILLVCAIAIVLVQSNKKTRKCVLASFFILSGIAAVGAIMLSPVPVVFDRSMFGATIFILIGLGILLSELYSSNLKWMKCGLAALCLTSSLIYVRALADLGYTMYQYLNRESYVSSQKEAGNQNPVVPQIYREFETDYNPLHGLNDITEYPKYWVNTSYAKVHKLEGVQSTTLNQWTLIYEHGDSSLMNIQDMNEYVNTVIADNKYTVLITCSKLDPSYADYMEIIKLFGIKEDATNFIAVYQNNELLLDEQDSEGIDGSVDLNGYYAYLSSYSSGDLSDIMIGDTEYTNDNFGISLVVWNREENRVVDSVTWNVDNGMTGIRYKLEK